MDKIQQLLLIFNLSFNSFILGTFLYRDVYHWIFPAIHAFFLLLAIVNFLEKDLTK